MVYSHNVEELQLQGEAFHPPGKAFLLVTIPIVERVSPKLAILVEIIRRNARQTGKR